MRPSVEEREKEPVGPGSYDPDVSAVKSGPRKLTLYQSPKRAQDNAVDKIYKYIKEIKELKQPETSVEAPVQNEPECFVTGTTNPSLCSFKSRTKKYEFPLVPDVPGPGSYNMNCSFGERKRSNTFAREKRSIDIMSQNNTILIRTQEETVPGVGEYFKSRFPLHKRVSLRSGSTVPSISP